MLKMIFEEESMDDVTLKKNGFMLQKQPGFYALRFHIVGGAVTAQQLKVMEQVAVKYARGEVHLTSRQSIEIPFIKKEDIEQVLQELRDGGCEPATCGPAVRTITACQGNVVCSSGNIDTQRIAKELDQRFYGKDLPHKFKIGVTGCANNCLKAEENDCGIKVAKVVHWEKENCVYCGACIKICPRKAITMESDALILNNDLCIQCGRCERICPKKSWVGETGYKITFGGLFGNTISKGESILPVITSEETVYQVVELALEFFCEHGKRKERFKFTLERVGWESFVIYLRENLELT